MDVLPIALYSLTCVLLIIYVISNRKFNYWKMKKVPYVKPSPFIGNYGDYIYLRKCKATVSHQLCSQFPDEPYFGTFYGTEPALVVTDPDILKYILTKDFACFHGREVSDHTHKELVTQNMFFSSGDRWKVFRQNLTTMFSSAKMKNMFYLIKKCNDSFENMLDREFSISEIQGAGALTTRYTLDSICSCVFGVESKTMDEDATTNPFCMMADEVFNTTSLAGFKVCARAMWPGIFYGLGLKLFSQSIGHFFHRVLMGVFEHRQNQSPQRHDFIDQLLNLKKEKYITVDCMNNVNSGRDEKVRLEVTNDLLVSQCVLFFSAGFETSATTLCLTLYEFAKTPEAQNIAITEIDEYLLRQGGILDYNCVTELPYLDACVHETMRLYPILGVLTREAMNNYTFPTGLSVEKGLRIHIPLYHIHHDPRNFPEPEEYKPERFMPDAKHEIYPYTYFPFGGGPRMCIGRRFAMMQVLAGLVTFLKKYRVELAEGTPRTVEFNPKLLTTRANCEIKLKLIKRGPKIMTC